MQKLHYVSLTKTLAYEMAGEWHLGVVALEVDGCPSYNPMSCTQGNRPFVDTSSGLQVMASSRSHENALQGHMVNLSEGLKRKLGDISKLCECTHVCISLEDPMDLSTSSWGGGSLV